MKWWLLLFVAFVCVPAQAAQIGFWTQDEASGNLIDATGNHPPGIPNVSPTYGQPGVPNGNYGAINIANAIGTAIEYGPSSSDEFVTIGTDNNNPVMNLDNTSGFTVMGWLNPLAPTVASTYRFLSTGSGAGVDRGWGVGLRLPTAGSGAGASIRFTSYGLLDNDSSTFNVTFGDWMHIAVTYNNGSISYFLNGNALDSDTSVFGNESINGRLVIGGRFGSNDVDQANGRLDGIQVYNQILTATEIQSAAAGSVSVPEPSTVVLGALAALCLLYLKRRAKSPSL